MSNEINYVGLEISGRFKKHLYKIACYIFSIEKLALKINLTEKHLTSSVIHY